MSSTLFFFSDSLPPSHYRKSEEQINACVALRYLLDSNTAPTGALQVHLEPWIQLRYREKAQTSSSRLRKLRPGPEAPWAALAKNLAQLGWVRH